MPGQHIPLEQRMHAQRQGLAGVAWHQVIVNQRVQFGERAPVMSRRSIARYVATHGELKESCTKYFPSHSLTDRHKRLLREAMSRLAEYETVELSAMLAREEASSGISGRREFAAETVNRFLRTEERMTPKLLTIYDPRKDAHESARCRSALKRYPVKCLVVVDACHSDTRKDSARRRGRSKVGTRAYSRQFLAGDGKLRTIMGVMTVEGMQVDMCGFLVRSSALDGLQTTPSF